MAQLRGEEVRAQAALALGRREDAIAQVGRKGVQRGRGCGDGRLQAGADGGQLALLVGGRGGREGLLAELADPRQLGERNLRVQSADGPTRDPDEARAGGVQDGGDPLDPLGGGGQAHAQRGELAGEQEVDSFAQEVDPGEGIPRLGAQLGLGEAHRRQLAEDDVAVDLLVGGQGIVREGGEGRAPPIDERHQRPRAGLGLVGPHPVVVVVAEPGREDRAGPEQVGEEAVDELVEGGHGWLRAGGGTIVRGG